MTIKVRHYAPILAGVMLVGLLLFQGWQLTTLLREKEWDYSRTLLLNLSDRAQAALGRRFEERDEAHIGQAMSDFYLYKRDTQAYLVDETNRVMVADRLGFDGLLIDKLPIKVDPGQIAQARTTLQGNIVADRENGTLTSYYPISISPAGERPFSRRAVLILRLDSHETLQETRNFVARSILQSLFVVVLLVATLMIGLHFALTRRVTGLLAVSNAYLAGNAKIRNLDRSQDEIGDIARAFNQVADTVEERQRWLEESQQALSQLNQTLEQRVADRTQALASEIEERSRIATALRASEAELQTVLDLAPDGIIVITEQGIVAKFNAAAETLFGWTEAEMQGVNLNRLMPEPHSSGHDGYLQAYRDTGVKKVIGMEREVEGKRRDGKLIPIALSVSEIQLAGATHYIGIVRDISARKESDAALARARQSLMEAEKMAALGGLVAGVAHEVNTPVGVGVTAVSHLSLEVQSFVDRYRQGQMKRSDLEQLLTTCADSIQIIESNLMRASQLIRSFKDIAVDQTGDDFREISVRDYIEQVLTSLRPRLKNRPITVNVSVEPELMRVRLQPGGISQIVANLVINSLVHAFDQDQSGQIDFLAEEKDGALALVYQDNGKGMPKAILDRIFDPFFTTKRGQGGSGLGMNIVYNLVTQKFGGTISCESSPGAGTRFIMHIPSCVVSAPGTSLREKV